MGSPSGTSKSLPIMRKPIFKVLVLFLALCLVFILYGRQHFYRDPGSMFYDPARAYERRYSAYREEEAQKYIQRHTQAIKEHEAGGPKPEIVKAGKEPKMCVHFATVKRAEHQYIDNSVASVLEGLSPEEREDMYVSVFFANTDPTVHPSYHQQWLHEVVDEVYTQSKIDSDRFARMQELEEVRNFSIKGVADYTYGLQHCYDLGMANILMFEGDVIVAEGWFVETLKAMDHIKSVMGLHVRDWLYLRLFNQERSMGWGSTKVFGNHEYLIILLVIGIILGLSAFLRKRGHTSLLTDNQSVYILCLVIIPLTVVLFYQTGKANILPPKPGVYEENFGCCSQALLFSREQIPRLIRYLKWRDHGQVDMMVNTHARVRKFKRLSLYPVQVQHVGMESVRGTIRNEAQAIWSMAFEDKDPVALKHEHWNLVHQIYHDGIGSG